MQRPLRARGRVRIVRHHHDRLAVVAVERLQQVEPGHLWWIRSQLRKKLEDAGVPDVPVNVRGVGYKFGGRA